jgi:CBS domain-containing protein
MKIADLMTAPVRTCRVDDTLNAAANVMWEHDCGIVPVVDADGRLVGVVTDRDICMAVFFHGARLVDLPVREVMARDLHTLPPEASIHDALELMRDMQVRRVPVVDAQGAPVGLLSLADVATAWRRRDAVAGRELRDDDVGLALAAVTRSRRGGEPSVLVVEVTPAPKPAPAPVGKPAQKRARPRRQARKS